MENLTSTPWLARTSPPLSGLFNAIEGKHIPTDHGESATWHMHAYTEEIPKKYFSPPTFQALKKQLSLRITVLATGKNPAASIPP